MNRKNKLNLINIGGKLIGADQSVFIIAEAGVNHNGRLDLALKLIDEAAKAGADAIKFQTFRAEQVVTESGKMAEYQKKNIGKSESQISMLKKLELNEKYYPRLIKYALKRKIIFLSTPHGGFESVDFLNKIGIPAFKFGSGDLTNLPLLEYAAKFRRPMIVSAGMATLDEIKEAVRTIRKAGNNKIVILHCTTDYPCPLEEVNLSAMAEIAKKTGVLTGYSDHTLGSQVAVMASALGACMIEKHLTLDKNIPGPDHKASANPEEFKAMVGQVRKVKLIMGSPAKKPSKNELAYIPVVRKSVVSAASIKKGETFNKINLAIKRPGTGLAPKYFLKIIGKTAKKNIKAGRLIKKNDY